MIKREYYSLRTGKISPSLEISLDVLKAMFLVVYKKLDNEGYFQKYFGIECTDGYMDGSLGGDIESIVFINLRKNNLYPIIKNLPSYTEDDLFDIIEFLYDNCSKGTKGFFHEWNQCGYHYEEFNDKDGRQYYRELLNPILKDYKDGYELSASGEMFILSDTGLKTLLEAEIPATDNENITDRIDAAINKFRRHKSTLDERRAAVRELADVLEFLKPEIKRKLNRKDENDLFNIANNFGIRHHNADQQTEYDKPVWFSWMFYFYLATIHTVLRLTKKEK